MLWGWLTSATYLPRKTGEVRTEENRGGMLKFLGAVGVGDIIVNQKLVVSIITTDRCARLTKVVGEVSGCYATYQDVPCRLVEVCEKPEFASQRRKAWNSKTSSGAVTQDQTTSS